MADMRKWHTGTWEVTSSGKGRWRLKGQFSKSPAQLGEIFGVTLTGKTDSEKYWRMYLEHYREAQRASNAQQSPFPQRASNLMRAMDSATGASKTILRDALDATMTGNIMENDHAGEVSLFDPNHELCPQEPNWHNDTVNAEIALHQAIAADLSKPSGLKKEIDMWIDRKGTSKDKTEWMLSLELLRECCGLASYKDITVDHWRTFCKRVEDSNWSPRTKYNRWKKGRAFMLSLAKDRDLKCEWLHNPQYIRKMPHGNKTQWTWQQVQDALAKAKGTVRTALLLGLNCGWYREDVAEMKPDNFDGQRMNKRRQKLNHEENAMVCSHLLWTETIDTLTYGLTSKTIDEEFRAFRQATGCPVQKALRKTVSQWIDDYHSEEAARLYRGERASGNHGKFYIKLTEPQKQKLDDALTMVHGIVFEGKFPANWQG